MSQPTLNGQFDPSLCGLYPKLIRDGSDGRCIDHAVWMRTLTGGEFAGTCPQCFKYLIPRRPEYISNVRTDYEANCQACDYVVVAPNGRVRRKSVKF